MISLDTAELLHVTLGSLAAVLEAEGHPWAGLAQEMVATYTHQAVGTVGDAAFGDSAATALGVLTERIELLSLSDYD